MSLPTYPLSWSKENVAQWLESVNLSAYSNNFLQSQIDGAKLVQLNRRSITPLVQNFRDAMKLEFEIKKLNEMIEKEQIEKENSEREELVLKKLEEISVKKNEGNEKKEMVEEKVEEKIEIEPKIEENKISTIETQTSNPEGGEREINQWTSEEVDEWACKIIGPQYKGSFAKKGINGEKLFEMDSNKISNEVKIRGIPLMKLMHEIDKLKEPIMKRIQEEKEKMEKTFIKEFS